MINHVHLFNSKITLMDIEAESVHFSKQSYWMLADFSIQ